MTKKEDIYVKLTKKNIDKVISILEERCFKHDLLMAKNYLKSELFEILYVYCVNRIDGDYWVFSLQAPIKTTRIKPKLLRKLLENERLYKSYYWGNPFWKGNPLWEVTKGVIGDKGLEHKPKTLEVGKWYKDPTFYTGRLMFKFNGKFGDAVAIGFGSDGEFAKIIGVHKEYINRYEEATPEEVVKAFEYHFENFADKRRNITTAELRDILNQFHREEISFSKVVELVNEKITK